MWVSHGCSQFQVTSNQTYAGIFINTIFQLWFASGKVFPKLKLLLATSGPGQEKASGNGCFLRDGSDQLFHCFASHLQLISSSNWSGECDAAKTIFIWHRVINVSCMHNLPASSAYFGVRLLCSAYFGVAKKKEGFSCSWTVLGHEMCSCTFSVL